MLWVLKVDSTSSSSVWLICRARLAGQTEDGGRFEGHCGQAEERSGLCSERDHGKGDAVFCPQSKPSDLLFKPIFCTDSYPKMSLQYLFVYLCNYLWQKQMTYLETQQNETQAAKEEARRLRTKMKTFERYLHSDKYCHIRLLIGCHFINHNIDCSASV